MTKSCLHFCELHLSKLPNDAILCLRMQWVCKLVLCIDIHRCDLLVTLYTIKALKEKWVSEHKCFHILQLLHHVIYMAVAW